MKKGFTLAELIGVIVVLALIALITVPAVADVLANNKKKLCEIQMDNIMSAARNWGANNLTSLPGETDSPVYISLKELVDSGYIDGDITNPMDNEKISENLQIKISRDSKKYKYEFDGTSVSEMCSNE